MENASGNREYRGIQFGPLNDRNWLSSVARLDLKSFSSGHFYYVLRTVPLYQRFTTQDPKRAL